MDRDGNTPTMNEAQKLERCHQLAIEARAIFDTVREELAPAPVDFDDTDVSLPAQLARVGGLVDDIVDESKST